MRAKIFHAEGKTDEALKIYQSKFAGWYETCGQKSEQLFAKDTAEYYEQMQKNMFELANFAADKLGRKIFFDKNLSMPEKAEAAIQYGNYMLRAYHDIGEEFFLIIAHSFLGRMRNDFSYRGGSDEEITEITDLYLLVTRELSDIMQKNTLLQQTYTNMHHYVAKSNLLDWTVEHLLKKSAVLLQNPKFSEVIASFLVG